MRPEYYYGYYPRHADLPRTPTLPLDQAHPQTRRLRGHFQAEAITEDQIRVARAAYHGLTEFCDDKIDEILAAVDANRLADNTIVVHLSDHGEMNGEHGMWYKCSFYEHSSRIPMIVRWPGQVAAGRRIRQVTSLVDLTATIVDAACSAPAEGSARSSLLPLLREDVPEVPGAAISEYFAVGALTPARMLRRGPHKLN